MCKKIPADLDSMHMMPHISPILQKYVFTFFSLKHQTKFPLIPQDPPLRLRTEFVTWVVVLPRSSRDGQCTWPWLRPWPCRWPWPYGSFRDICPSKPVRSYCPAATLVQHSCALLLDCKSHSSTFFCTHTLLQPCINSSDFRLIQFLLFQYIMI